MATIAIFFTFTLLHFYTFTINKIEINFIEE